MTHAHRVDSTQKSETKIQSAILDMLKWHPKVAKAERRNVGGVYRNGRYIKYGNEGDLDIVGMLKGGRHFEIEIKMPGENPTDKQQENIDEILGYGGLAGVAYSVEDAREIVER